MGYFSQTTEFIVFIVIMCVTNIVWTQELSNILNYTPSGPLIHCHFLLV